MAGGDHTDEFGEETPSRVPKAPPGIEKLEAISECLESEIIPALRVIKAGIHGLDDAAGHALLIQAVINRVNDLANGFVK